MRSLVWLFLLRLVSLVGLLVSVAVLVDYSSPSMAFCSAGSGCSAVRASGLGYLLVRGTVVPYLPILGVLGFATIFSGTFFSSPRTRRLVSGGLSVASGLVSLGLLALQAFWLQRFCSLCVIVDIAALDLAVLALLLWRGGFEESARLDAGGAERSFLSVTPVAWGALSLLAVVAPLSFSSIARTTTLPDVIAELAEPEKVTVVEFFDYQCPHCRVALPALEEAVRAFDQPVHEVRLPVGLPGHELGRRAARLHVCSEEQGKAGEVAALLLQGPALTEAHLTQVGQLTSLDQKKLLECLESERPDRTLEAILERLRTAEFLGLPTTYVGHQRLLGSAPYEVYLDALEAAAEGRDRGGLPPWAYWALVVGIAGAILWLGRRPGRAVPPASAD